MSIEAVTSPRLRRFWMALSPVCANAEQRDRHATRLGAISSRRTVLRFASAPALTRFLETATRSRQIYYPIYERHIFDPMCRSGHRKLTVLLQVTVGIDLDHIDVAIVREP